MAKINIDRLMDLIMENMADTREYRHSTAIYRKKHGHGVYFENAMTPEEKHIVWYYHRSSDGDYHITVMAEILGIDGEAQKRLWTAARAIRRWYERTNWNRLMDTNMADQIERYIFQ